MAENKWPKFETLDALVEFLDNNDTSDYWQAMPEVDCEIAIKRKIHLVAIEGALAERLDKVARDQQISPQTLIQTWLQEKLDATV